MTKRGITMTIEVPFAKVSAENLFEPNEVLNLDRPSDSYEPISAISFAAKRPSIDIPWNIVLQTAFDAAFRFVSDSSWKEKSWLFFGATDMWRIPNAATRQKKFWNAASLAAEFMMASPEVEVYAGNKHRFAVLVKANQQSLPSYVEWVRASQSGFFIISGIDFEFSAHEVGKVFSCAFSDEESNIDWNLAVQTLAKSDDILVRCSGSFDDPDAAVDLIYNPSLTRP